MEKSYYDILGISPEATENEIKKAYILKLRQYPNEKHPEQFQLIRKAYETLSNPATKKEYDTMSMYGEEIERLQNEASKAIDDKDFAAAIHFYKKILMIEPSLQNIRNQYALALTYHGQYDKAIHQFEKLVNLHTDNATYTYNLAFAFEKKGELYTAIDYYKKAYELDPNDANIIYAISNVFLDLQDYDSARLVIKDALKRSSNQGFHQFMYLFRHLQVDIYAKDSNGIGDTLEKIEHLLEQYPEEKAYVANEFGVFAANLFDYKQYKWAYYLTEKGIQLDPANNQLRSLHEDTKKNKELYQEFELLEHDDKVINPLKFCLFLFLFGDEYTEEEFKQDLDHMYENVELSAMYEPAQTIKSLQVINIKYPHLYEARKEFFGNVKGLSEKHKATNEQYESMKNDSSIVNSLKRLIALYLSNVSDDERSHYFDDIIDEMSYEPASNVKYSIDRLRTSYPNLYQLNPDFLEEIKKKLNDHQKNNNSYHASSHSTHHSNRTSTNSSSCFVATAAFGSPLALELDYLRYWRDEYVRKTATGRLFINIYYRIGRYIAIPVKNSRLLRKLSQKIIYKIVNNLDDKLSLRQQFEQQQKKHHQNRKR